MPPDIASWDPEHSPGRSLATFGPSKRWRACALRVIPNSLLGAPLRLLGLLSAGVRAGCSGLQVPRGGPNDAGTTFSQSAHLPPEL